MAAINASPERSKCNHTGLQRLKCDGIAPLQSLGRTRERGKRIRRGLFQQQNFDLSARAAFAARGPRALQARRDDLGVVDGEGIAGREQFGQIAHEAVLARSVLAHHKKPRRVARGRRAQRDQLLGKFEVEIGDTHYPMLRTTAAMIRSCAASSR
jgi:hypothetical protein